MNKRYNRISLAWGIPGILLQVVGLGIEQPLVMKSGDAIPISPGGRLGDE